jgi:hypothetical protein
MDACLCSLVNLCFKGRALQTCVGRDSGDHRVGLLLLFYFIICKTFVFVFHMFLFVQEI